MSSPPTKKKKRGFLKKLQSFFSKDKNSDSNEKNGTELPGPPVQSQKEIDFDDFQLIKSTENDLKSEKTPIAIIAIVGQNRKMIWEKLGFPIDSWQEGEACILKHQQGDQIWLMCSDDFQSHVGSVETCENKLIRRTRHLYLAIDRLTLTNYCLMEKVKLRQGKRFGCFNNQEILPSNFQRFFNDEAEGILASVESFPWKEEETEFENSTVSQVDELIRWPQIHPSTMGGINVQLVGEHKVVHFPSGFKMITREQSGLFIVEHPSSGVTRWICSNRGTPKILHEAPISVSFE